MKKIVFVLALLPHLAFAHSALRCDTFSNFGEVSVMVTSETAMSNPSSILHVVGDGIMRDVDVLVQATRQPTIPDQVVLQLKTLKPGTTEIDEEESRIEAILTVKTKTLSENPLVLQADGVGHLQITKRPNVGRGLSFNYDLTNCQGVL